MAYDPRSYWDERPRVVGADYVGPGSKQQLAAHEATQFKRALERLMPDDVGFLLDYGCGSARLTEWLEARCQTYLGVDISRTGIDMARQKLPDSAFLHMRTDKIPCPDSTVSMLLCAVVLQHMPDLTYFASEARRVLTDDGAVVVLDQWPHPNVEWHEHMFPRHPIDVGELLGLQPMRLIKVGDHWGARFQRSDSGLNPDIFRGD